jgi:hypothetical protein
MSHRKSTTDDWSEVEMRKERGTLAGMAFRAFLRRLFTREAREEITHTFVCGASRSGKSSAELVRLIACARRRDRAIVLLDPPGTLAEQFLLHLDALGQTERVIYDRLADTDRVPGYEWLTPSGHPDPLQREAENDESVREFTSILLRRRGIHDPAKTPLIEEVLLAALRLHLTQQPPSPLPWLAEAFNLGSPLRARLLARCTDPGLVRTFREFGALSPTARRTEVAPAERILRAVLLSPAFRVRCGDGTIDLDRFLDGKGILILDGGSRGNLSRDAAAVMMGAVILRVIRHCRTGAESKVVLVLDEATSAGLLGVYESQALSEAGKWGLEFHILVQSPFGFGSEEIRHNVLQNCWRHEWFRQGSPEAARLAAEDLAIPELNPLRVHYTEFRHRTVEEEIGHIPVSSHSEWSDSRGSAGRSTSRSSVLWPRRRDVSDRLDRYTSLPDQILLMQKELMLLEPGCRFVRAEAVSPEPEYVPLLRSRLTGHAGKVRFHAHSSPSLPELATRMKQRPEFRLPGHDYPTGNGYDSRGAAHKL